MVAWSRCKGYLARMPDEHPALQLPLWRILPGLSDYALTLAAMEAHVDRMAAGQAGEEIWLVEHPAVLTAGTSTRRTDLLQPGRFPVHEVGRGGQFTYHGPGQRVVYPMLDLSRRGRDVRRYVTALEAWAIAVLADLGISAGTSSLGTGIWVHRQGDCSALDKIGAVGVRVRRWISFHGMALNVTTDLDHYSAIVPCGITGHGVTRVADQNSAAGMAAMDAALFNRLSVLLHTLSAANPPVIKTLEAAGECR
jgi:lipoyl(octanoyl) transferase